ncbi:MAG: hypothetical protein P8123_06100, partial [bacterium]
MSTEIGSFPTCDCDRTAAADGTSKCPLHLATSKLFDALANLENMAVLLGKMQRAGMTVSPETFDLLA